MRVAAPSPLLAAMNAATRRLIAARRRAVCGSLTAALLAACSWGLASPAAATPAHAHDDPVTTDPFGPGGPWQPSLPYVYGHWSAGPPGSWTRPVTTVDVSAPYGIRGDWSAGHHTGVDLAVPVGTTVRSVGSGEVVFAGRSGAYGKAVTIRMADGNYTLFAHLSKISVEEGDRVRAGTVVGESGNTGRTTGPHLHFEVRAERDYGSDVDPIAYLERRGVRIL
jgi:murein DD-endopeptidase MepM/ murein hydrolase activator NlpD